MENITPKTRLEHYLAKIAGEDVITPEVKTRLEYYLNEIAQNGGGGGAGLPSVTEADDGKVLGVVGSEWDKMDKGWNVTNIYNIFVEEQTVAVESSYPWNVGEILNPSENELVEGQTYTIVLDGVEYVVECQKMEGVLYLGELNGDAPDLTNYPFFISPTNEDAFGLYTTLDVGNHTVEIAQTGKEVTTTADFDLAVQSAKGVNAPLMVHGTYVDGDPYFEGDGFEYTYEQLAEIVDSGRPVYLRTDGDFIRAVVSERNLGIAGMETLDNVALIIHEEELGRKALKARFTIVGNQVSTSEFRMHVMEMHHFVGEECAGIIQVWPGGE